MQVERYWLFAVLCLLVALVILRLLLRERITLQGSMSFLGFLLLFAVAGLFPHATGRISAWMGFALPSNFLFSLGIMLLALLHLRSLVTLSRLEMRTITLTQELALLRERLENSTRRSDAA
jgi:hypothetical protein